MSLKTINTTIEKPASKNASKDALLKLYEEMLLIRKFELAVQENYKKGEIPGFIHLCIGQEAVAVGVCSQLKKTDWITSTHRGHGHALAKGVDPKAVLAELYGKAAGCSGGRGGSMHLYSFADGLLGTNGLVGGGIPLAVGLGLSAKVKKQDHVAVAFFGDGAINHGTFHESMCLAAMHNLPVVFICENNLYATCTPYAESGKNISISSKAATYGIKGITVDGNDVFAVQEVAKQSIEQARAGLGPTLIEAVTYRTVGHHEGDTIAGTYRTLEEVEAWKLRCPLILFEKQILDGHKVTKQDLERVIDKVEKQIQEIVSFARSSPYPDPATVTEHSFSNPINPAVALKPYHSEETTSQSWLVAVRDGIVEEMRSDQNVIYIGEGIGERGGTFGHTKNLWQEFGGNRIIDTPICELAFTGAAAAAAASGCRTIADLMFADFVFEAASQIVNQASKLKYMSNGQINVPMIIRAGAGQIKQAGPQHSGTFHSVWAHIPGLIVVVPSTPADAKGLMKTALRASDPVIFLEPKALLSTKGPVPTEEYYIPFGKARLVSSGDDITIVTFGMPVLSCALAAKKLREEEAIQCEVIDLRTIVPLDLEAIVESLTKTGRLLVVEEAYTTCSFAAEIMARITEVAFDKLKAPAGRLNQLSVPQPFSPVLETEVGINAVKVRDAVKAVLAGKPLTAKSTHFSGIHNASPVTDVPLYDEITEKSQLVKSTNNPDTVDIIIPNIGLTITEVTIERWHKAEGDYVNKGEELLDFETDKSTISLEAEVSGTISRIMTTPGETVPIGAVIGTIIPG